MFFHKIDSIKNSILVLGVDKPHPNIELFNLANISIKFKIKNVVSDFLFSLNFHLKFVKNLQIFYLNSLNLNFYLNFYLNF